MTSINDVCDAGTEQVGKFWDDAKEDKKKMRMTPVY